MENKTVKTLAIAALVVAIGGLTMGYAALTQTLEINSSATVQSAATTWDIHFEKPDAGAATGHAVKGTIALDTTDVTVSGVVLKTNGDSVTYTFDVKNAGQVNAKLTTLTPKPATATGLKENGYSYTLVYADTKAPVAVNDTLDAGVTKKMQLTITLTVGDTNSDLPATNVDITGLGYTLVYTQA